MLSHLVILCYVRCAALLTICICIAAGVSPGVNSPHRADALVIKLLLFYFVEKNKRTKKTRHGPIHLQVENLAWDSDT